MSNVNFQKEYDRQLQMVRKQAQTIPKSVSMKKRRQMAADIGDPLRDCLSRDPTFMAIIDKAMEKRVHMDMSIVVVHMSLPWAQYAVQAKDQENFFQTYFKQFSMAIQCIEQGTELSISNRADKALKRILQRLKDERTRCEHMLLGLCLCIYLSDNEEKDSVVMHTSFMEALPPPKAEPVPSTIYRYQPVPVPVVDPQCCNYCKVVTKTLRVCGRCKNVRYCGPGCQRKDWTQHKKVCCQKE